MLVLRALVSIFFLLELSARELSDDGDKKVFTGETWLSSITTPTNLVDTHVSSDTYEVTTQKDTDEGPTSKKWIKWWNKLTIDFERVTGMIKKRRRNGNPIYRAKEIIEKIMDWTNLCKKFKDDFGIDICESDNGTSKRNSGGRRKLETEDEGSRDMVISNNAHRMSHNNKRKIMVLKTENKDYSISDALDHLSYCAAGAVTTEEAIQKYVPVSVRDINWREAVEKVMRKAKEMKISVDEYDHAIIVLPNSVDFEGSFGKGLLTSWFSVMPEEAFYETTLVLHELGHNLGLKHSKSDIEEYDDKHCIMGDPGDDTNACFNGHKAWFLGWYKNNRVTVQPNKFHRTLMIDLHVYLQQGANDNEYVVVQIKYGAMNIYVMYYAKQNVMSITKGAFGEIEGKVNNVKRTIPYAKDSNQISEIVPGSKYTYGNFVFEHDVDVNSKHYLLTYPTLPPTVPPSPHPTFPPSPHPTSPPLPPPLPSPRRRPLRWGRVRRKYFENDN